LEPAAPADPREDIPAPGNARLWQRIFLILGLLWALLVIVPDFYRLYGNLSAFGFSADNDGRIYKVDDDAGPTAAGHFRLQINDRIALTPGACWQPASTRCADYLAVFGGMGGLAYVRDGTTITLPIIRNGRTIQATLAATPAPLDNITRFVLALDEIAGVVVILLAFQLAWIRPGYMTTGFFLYAMWFNPGQYFAFYAWLQGHPVLLLVQEALQAMAQGAGYAGFLVFALRFPHDRTEPQFEGVQRWAVGIGVMLSVLQLLSFANVFGLPTEGITRCAILGGYIIAFYAFFVAWQRRKLQTPVDYQRMRWVLWGCGIGIPTFVFADSNAATSLWSQYVWSFPIWHGWSPDEAVLEAFYLASGVLAIFISRAVRHPRIVNVTYELRGVAAVTLVLVVAAGFEAGMHEPLRKIFRFFGMPHSAQFPTYVAVVLFCSRIAHQTSHAADHLLNRAFYHASTRLDEIGQRAEAASSDAEIDELLVYGPCREFHLASAGVFREKGDSFVRAPASHGWSEDGAPSFQSVITPDTLAKLKNGNAVRLPFLELYGEEIPSDITVPVLAVPVIFSDILYAVAIYGPHNTGTDLDKLELETLKRFAKQIATGYASMRLRALEAAGLSEAPAVKL
jgi:hypothetical protein